MNIPDRFIANLREEIINADYCFLCKNHPSHGHEEDCPFYTEEV